MYPPELSWLIELFKETIEKGQFWTVLLAMGISLTARGGSDW
jgi:hypothetical protein